MLHISALIFNKQMKFFLLYFSEKMESLIYENKKSIFYSMILPSGIVNLLQTARECFVELK